MNINAHAILSSLVLALALVMQPASAIAQEARTRTNTSDAGTGTQLRLAAQDETTSEETEELAGIGDDDAVDEEEEIVWPRRSWRRLGGATRYETMAAIVAEGFARSRSAIIATGANFPDALAASSLAGAKACPVILTEPDHLTDDAWQLLVDLDVQEAIIMGGPAAVSEQVKEQIQALDIDCGRIEGIDRYETSVYALRIARQSGSASDTVIIATGRNYPDSLSIGPWAYATATPILLVDESGQLSDQAIDEIANHPQIKHVILVGGTSVVSRAVMQQLGGTYTFERLGGEDRYETSEQIARWEADRGFAWDQPALTTGRNYPDALAACSLQGRNASPLLISDADDSCTLGLLFAKRNSVDCGYLLGGTAAVATSNPVETYRPHRKVLDGVDISGWDEGIDISQLEADFIIIKATEGLLLSEEGILYNPWYEDWADEALAQGKLVGFYHYAAGKDPVTEADEFYEAIKDYKGRAIACLDWEGDGNEAFDTGVDVAWCKLFLDRIADRFGGTPFLYTSKDYANAYDWSEVARTYPLWGAEYPDYKAVPGYDGDPWQSEDGWGAWGETPTIFQYTGTGRLEANGGIDLSFDFNLFLGTRADWLSYQRD